jgi:hypothetical protein
VAVEEHLATIVGFERVQFGPVIEILERIVRLSLRPSARSIEGSRRQVFLVELATRRHVVGWEPPLERRPPGGSIGASTRSATPAPFAASPDPTSDDARDWHDAKASARETTASDVVVFIDGRPAPTASGP